MSPDPTPALAPRRRSSVFRNWLSLAGLVVVVGSLFSFFLLLVLDTLAQFSNPYVGILTYLVAPAFLMLGLFLALLGAFLRHRQILKTSGPLPALRIDLTRPRDRRWFGLFLAGGVLFLLISALGSYHTYHYTESVQFCGQACHSVMKPEYVTYLNGPHARVSCAACHIGKGASWYVRSKLSGAYQVYATMADKYPRPIPTPVKNLRPAQETCEECHWPQKFVGNLERTYHYFLSDETNTPFSVRMLMHVGGADPTHGPVGGIHWHMNVGNRIEYLASDEARQKIPYVRMTELSHGVVTEFRTARFTNAVDEASLRQMDCIDCHNRPAHRYQTPNTAVNLAITLGKIDRGLPLIKSNALYVLTESYTNETQALRNIATTLSARYPGDPRIRPAIEAVQQIYRDNFFPEMKASWKTYPDNIGHKDWPGCFRCHDGLHKTADGKRTIEASDCNACHTILAQGSGAELDQLTPKGQKFKHPGDEVDGDCNDCHTGGL
ncbi:MAG TPA: NapC/NirT family cytochrome c [Candidatus Paceibacterota bacterium]|nr:NapC/NirT family cytochrome c [Verrucomicrobiota bacterium]HSA12780.1 NapC/NirT family cytochrome c [Candidatus Paceibacterota bacterium]